MNQLLSSVYVFKDDRDFVKIGISSDVFRRLNTIETSCCISINKEWESIKCYNARKVEKELHTFFAKHRMKGEWFKFDFDKIVEKAKTMNYSLLKPAKKELSKEAKSFFEDLFWFDLTCFTKDEYDMRQFGKLLGETEQEYIFMNQLSNKQLSDLLTIFNLSSERIKEKNAQGNDACKQIVHDIIDDIGADMFFKDCFTPGFNPIDNFNGATRIGQV